MMISVAHIKSGGASPRRRTVLFVGSSDPFVTSRAVLESADVAAGSTFEDLDEFRQVIGAVEYEVAMTRALDIISRREVSRRMLERRLTDDGYSAAMVDRVVQRVIEFGYIDDHRYAKLVWRAETSSGKGPGRAVQKLRTAGVDPQVIQAALEECQDEQSLPDPLETARALATRWGAPFTDRALKQKTVRKLLSRGFSLDIALKACDGTDLDADLG